MPDIVFSILLPSLNLINNQTLKYSVPNTDRDLIESISFYNYHIDNF